MTWPLEYQKASVNFERFMIAARDAAGLQTTNMAWTMVEGVLLTFRRRLTVPQAIEFANILPPLLRALFLDNWHPAEPPEPFAAREALSAEVQALRREHNFSPPNSIAAVASALRGVVDQTALSRVLASLPAEAQAFWSVQVQGADMSHLAKGTFEVKLQPLSFEGVEPQSKLARMSIEKSLVGDLVASTKGQMISAMTDTKGSAGYVAIERVTGTLKGKQGSFVLQHNGLMNRGTPSLSVVVVPDSGTHELEGLEGEFTINVKDGQHSYEFVYRLPVKP